MMFSLSLVHRPLGAFFTLFFIAATSVSLSSCAVLPKMRPANVYLLPGVPVTLDAEVAVTPLSLSLRVNRSSATGMLESRNIAVVPSGHRMQVYADSLWNKPPSLMLRDRLLETFRRSGRYEALSSDEKILFADYELDSDLHAFQSVYQGGNPHVLITLDVRLVVVASRRIIGSRYFSVTQPAADAEVEQVVTAFGQGADQLAAEVTEWLQVVLTQ